MKDLVLITNNFPVAYGETFLLYEAEYLFNAFERKVIITKTSMKGRVFEVPEDVLLLNVSPTTKPFNYFQVFLVMITHFGIAKRILCDEIDSIKRIFNRNLKFIELKSMFHYLFKAFELFAYIEKNVIPVVHKNTVFYSYWQNSAALALSILKVKHSNFKCVCRAHSGDVYFVRNKLNYLPCRNFISETLDSVFFISNDSLLYQEKLLYKKYNSYSISRLGTVVVRKNVVFAQSSVRTIVSCSNLISLKRVELIIEALALIDSFNIKWIHFGDGMLKESLLAMAEVKLSVKNNVEFKFMGNIPNAEIHRFYASNNIDLFVNVSESEGIPVSIMEAMSYGIVVLATNVGGTNEIVNEDNGHLLPSNLSCSYLANSIEYFLSLTEEKYRSYSNNAFKKWESEYSAKNNYKNFVTQLKA
jgi:glycosyltransferase involved in cell wall biosynthesis